MAQPPSGVVPISLLAGNIVISLALGALRGRSEHIWRTADGATWRKGSTVTMALWVLSIAARLVTIPLTHVLGSHVVAGAELELMLGLSFAAQHVVIAGRAGLLRALSAPVPSVN